MPKVIHTACVRAPVSQPQISMPICAPLIVTGGVLVLLKGTTLGGGIAKESKEDVFGWLFVAVLIPF